MIELRSIMLYDDKQVSEREGLYTVIGALVLAIILFFLLAAYQIQWKGMPTDGKGHASAPDATINEIPRIGYD
jgi:hypothetical protein